MSAPLTELIRRRQALKERINQLTSELDALDGLIFPRMARMAEAAEGGPIVRTASYVKHEQPNGRRLSNRAYLVAQPIPGQKFTIYQSGHFSNDDAPTNSHHRPIDDEIPPFLRTRRQQKGIAAAAHELLEEAGQPVRTVEIYRALLEAGVAVPGKHPVNNLSAHLSNDDRFVSTSQGWALRTFSLWSERQRSTAEPEDTDPDQSRKQEVPA